MLLFLDIALTLNPYPNPNHNQLLLNLNLKLTSIHRHDLNQDISHDVTFGLVFGPDKVCVYATKGSHTVGVHYEFILKEWSRPTPTLSVMR